MDFVDRIKIENILLYDLTHKAPVIVLIPLVIIKIINIIKLT